MNSELEETNDDRVVKDCPRIASVPLRFQDRETDLGQLLDHLKHEGKLVNDSLLNLIGSATELMTHEPNVVRIDSPVTVVGDLHGQFFDLAHIMEIAGGSPPERSFLFLGDYVDRGNWSVEILTYLYAIKLRFPKHVILLRGNHESRDMNMFFNFRQECLYKYNSEVFEAFAKSFLSLPLGAIVNNKYICMHGGFSPDLHNISQLFVIDRFIETPPRGLFCDILWSDPDPNPSQGSGFRPNDARGCSYYYSNEAVADFLLNNNLLSLIRAHEVQLEGFKTGPPMKGMTIPSHITIFSAPNYCDQYGNRGAILNIESDTDFNIVQFDASPHPFCLPNFMNVFDWSVPFVAEKVTELLHAILHSDSETTEEEEDLSPTTRNIILNHESSSDLVSILQDRLDAHHTTNRIRAKLRSVARVLALMRSVRRSHEYNLLHAAATSSEPSQERRYSLATEADFVTEKRRPSITHSENVSSV
jgi:serine/threonine-protein phosphatase 2B catalytic subunit